MQVQGFYCPFLLKYVGIFSTFDVFDVVAGGAHQIFKKTCPALPFGNPIDHHLILLGFRGKFLTFNKKKMA